MPPPDPPGSALSRGRGSRPSRRVVAVVAVVAVAALAVTIIARATGAVPTRPADEVVSVDLNRAVNHLDGTVQVNAHNLIGRTGGYSPCRPGDDGDREGGHSDHGDHRNHAPRRPRSAPPGQGGPRRIRRRHR